jgi:arabinogalactan oligomer/maltooligosaccharide transport system permease protein
MSSAFGLNTHSGLILAYLGGAMGINIWLMKGC